MCARRQVPPPRRGHVRVTVYDAVHRKRLGDAEALLKAKRWNGAIYLAGYVIECLLKVAVCLRQSVRLLPHEYETHNYDALLQAAGLRQPVDNEPRIRSIYGQLNAQWRVEIRYSSRDYDGRYARDVLNLVKEFKQWLDVQISQMK
jgi:HEPN domain-containing protein